MPTKKTDDDWLLVFWPSRSNIIKLPNISAFGTIVARNIAVVPAAISRNSSLKIRKPNAKKKRALRQKCRQRRKPVLREGNSTVARQQPLKLARKTHTQCGLEMVAVPRRLHARWGLFSS
jgi:hypothetical protein